MSRFNTGNPLDSNDPRDLDDNAKNLDLAVNAEQDTFQDRLGKSRLTWSGIVKAGTGDAGVIVPIVQQAVQDVVAGVDGQVAVAESAADRAETARDAAFVNADVYPDVEAGRSAVEIGEQFSVVSDNGRMLVRYRKDGADTSPEVARMATAESFLEPVTLRFEQGYYDRGTGAKSMPGATSIRTVDLIPARIVTIRLPVDRECRVHFFDKDGVFQHSSDYASTHAPVEVDGFFAISLRVVGGGVDISPEENMASIKMDLASALVQQEPQDPQDLTMKQISPSFEQGFYANDGGGKLTSSTSIRTVDLISALAVTVSLPADKECRVHFFDKDGVYQRSTDFGSSHSLAVDGYFSISVRYTGGGIEISPEDSQAVIMVDMASASLFEVEAVRAEVEAVYARTITFESILGEFFFILDFENGTFTFGGDPSASPNLVPFRLRTVKRTEFIGNIASVTTSSEQECDIYLYDEAGNFTGNLGYSDNHENVEVNGSFNLLVRFKDQREISLLENSVIVQKKAFGGSAEGSEVYVTRDLPNGDYITSSSSDGYIALSGRNVFAGVRHIFAKVGGIQGKNPTFKVSYSGWAGQPTEPKHRLVWSLDPDGDRWLNFDNQENNDTESCWEFKNNQVFESDVIYVANMPNWTPGRYGSRIYDWINSPLSSPTASANDLYKVGRIEARYVPQIGKNVPAVDCYAFKVGTGPVAVALTSGVHPDECPGHYIFEGSVDAILAQDQLGSDLRSNFTFYIYPNINAQGLFAGTPRFDLQTVVDANRIWGDESVQSDLTSTYIPVWEADFGESLKVAFDYHSWPSAAPQGVGRALWYRTDIAQETPARTAFIGELSTYGDIAHNAGFTSNFTINHIMRQIGNPLLVMTAEYHHDFIFGVPHWREFGVDIMRSLVAIKDTLS